MVRFYFSLLIFFYFIFLSSYTTFPQYEKLKKLYLFLCFWGWGLLFVRNESIFWDSVSKSASKSDFLEISKKNAVCNFNWSRSDACKRALSVLRANNRFWKKIHASPRTNTPASLAGFIFGYMYTKIKKKIVQHYTKILMFFCAFWSYLLLSFNSITFDF